MYNFRNDKENRYALGYKIKPVYSADKSTIEDWEGSITRQDKAEIITMTIPVWKDKKCKIMPYAENIF